MHWLSVSRNCMNIKIAMLWITILFITSTTNNKIVSQITSKCQRNTSVPVFLQTSWSSRCLKVHLYNFFNFISKKF